MAKQSKDKPEGSVKEKFQETLDSLKKNERIEDLYSYARSNTADTIAYVAIILGILILFFNPFWGGIIIGVVAGLYFSKEVMTPIRRFDNFVEEQGMVRTLILGGLAVGLFIEAPWIFIGAAVAVGLKQLIAPDKIA